MAAKNASDLLAGLDAYAMGSAEMPESSVRSERNFVAVNYECQLRRIS